MVVGKTDAALSVRKAIAGLALLTLCALLLAPGAREAARALPALSGVDPVWVLAALLCQGLVYGSVAGILAAALGALDQPVSLSFLLQTGGAFLWANRALPGPALAGLAVLTFLLGKQNVPPAAAQAAAATFYVADYAAFLALALVALGAQAASGRLSALHPALLGLALGVIAAGVCAALLVYRAPETARRWAERSAHRAGNLLRRPAPEVWAARAGRATEAVYARWRALAQRPRALLGACLWAGAMHLGEAATLVCAARAFGARVPFGVAAAGYVAGNLAAIVSFLPGGLGLYEGAMVGALHALGGAPLAPALAATLLYRLLSVWLPAPIALSATRRALKFSRRKRPTGN